MPRDSGEVIGIIPGEILADGEFVYFDERVGRPMIGNAFGLRGFIRQGTANLPGDLKPRTGMTFMNPSASGQDAS